MKSMYMLNRFYKKVYIAVTLLLLTLSGCKKWLDAPAPLQVDQSTLFSNEQGFKDVLHGVYLHMGNRSLYGRDLSIGLLSVLGRSYDTTQPIATVPPITPAPPSILPTIGNFYYQALQYNVHDPEIKTAMKNVWDTMYLCISNLNNLLYYIDSKQNIFTGNNFNTVKGEALGLRAFLHFELLRLFAPAPTATNLSTPAIPYNKLVSHQANPPSSIGEVLASCEADLMAAKDLLSEDDLVATHFNAWGVKGLLARLYLYKGDLANAQTYALMVINANKIPLAVNGTDVLFSKEYLFGLSIYSINSFAFTKSVLNTNPSLGFTLVNQNNLYQAGSGSANDWRKSFVNPITGTPSFNAISTSPKKFYGSVPIVNWTPMIRLTEMYYIAAECAVANNALANATTLLDTVRVHRNLAVYTLPALTADSLGKEISKEYQKEFIGEGQVFYFYKRKNLPFSSLPFTKIPVVPTASYVFTKPE